MAKFKQDSYAQPPGISGSESTPRYGIGKPAISRKPSMAAATAASKPLVVKTKPAGGALSAYLKRTRGGR